MAKTAKLESEERKEAEASAPDFARAIAVMRNDIKPSEEANAESRGDLSAAWARVEECNVHKATAKFFRKAILEASQDRRDDVLRSFKGLCEAADIGAPADLVDAMQAPTDEPIKDDVEAPSPVDQMLAGEAKRRGKAPDELGGGPRKAGTKPAAKKPNLPTLRAVN